MKSIIKITLAIFLLSFACVHMQAQTDNELTELEQRIEKLEREIDALLTREANGHHDIMTVNSVPLSERDRFRISGHIQTQYSWGQKDATLGVGAPNENLEESFSRFGIRRGRLNFVFQEGFVSSTFQLELTDKGIGIRSIFFQLNDPIWGTNSWMRTGIFTLPFGYKVGRSSLVRESPERSAIVLDLFPGERDLGTMLSLRAPAHSPLIIFRLDAGIVSGNGRNLQIDSRVNFVGRLTTEKTIGRLMLGGSISYYHGGVFQGTENVYTMLGNAFELNSSHRNLGRFAKREYFGFDAQAVFPTALGMTRIKTEYIFGQQPGSRTSTRSWNASTRPNHDTFIRPMRGGYLMLVQDLGLNSAFSAVLKYDWYNPNTAVSGNEIGFADTNTGIADLRRTSYGFGLLWNASQNIRLTAYYELVRKETSSNLDFDFKGDLFTVRLQYRF